jgi:hypothetical protein
MSPLQRVVKLVGVLAFVLAVPSVVNAVSTNYYAMQGHEFAPAGPLAGDQINSAVALTTGGGFLVWQDNITDGDGYGISALRLDSSLSPVLGSFRVNQIGTGDQENPQVALLKGGGAVFAWQGGQQSFQHIYARFLNSSNIWVTGDIMVNTDTNHYQITPAIAVLTNGNILVTWSSLGQDYADGFQGVYAQLFSPTGQKIGGEMLVNQFTQYNQRSPVVAAFPNGNFIIGWVSEKERSVLSVSGTGMAAATGYNSVDIYARIFNSAGLAVGDEFLVNTSTNICANPAVSTGSDGSFFIAWSQLDPANRKNGWDVYGRPFNAAGTGGSVQLINTQLYGDQFVPKVSSIGTDYLVVWTSLGQDGSREGVFGQVLHGDGSTAGGEFQVNTTSLNAQKFQSVASDGVGRFFVTWSSYVGGVNSMDLYAQRYATTLQPLSAPTAPIVTPMNSSRLTVAWAPLAGFTVANYELYMDGSTTPIIVTNNMWSTNGLAPNTTHTFVLDYVLSDGRQSPKSLSATGTTWGSDDNADGLPDDWQTLYWGANYNNWPAPSTKLTPKGPTVLQVFQWGGSPFDPTTWLTQTITENSQGTFLQWNTRPGSIYQIMSSTDLHAWSNFGAPRFASGATDSVYLGLSNNVLVTYRIVRIRY